MKIDFDRLILLLLPIRLRTVRLFSLIQVFISPIVSLYNQLMIDITIMRYRAACTPQTVWLEKIVKMETGADIGVTTSDGKPYDFIVTYSSTTPERVSLAIQSIIDRYKLAGKSFAMVGGVATNITTWSSYVVELVEYVDVIDSTTWSDYVDELIIGSLTPCTISLVVDYGDGSVYIMSDVAVSSDVVLGIRFNYLHHGNPASTTRYFMIQDGEIQSLANHIDWTIDLGTLSWTVVSGPTPLEDGTYHYVVNHEFILQ